MVLPASPPDAEPGTHSVAPWIERIVKHLRLIRQSTLVLVDHANDAQLGPLVRGLAIDFPDLLVLTEAARLEDAPREAVIVLVVRAEDATWLNLNRPILADRSFKVILWSKRSASEQLVKKAPDFFNWISRHFECPQGPPAFAIHGLQAALRARVWAVDFRGKTLDDVFAAAFPKRKLIRVSVTAPDEFLTKAVKEAGAAWIAWTNVLDEKGALRVRQIVTNAHRRGRNILENARGTAPEAWPVFDALMNVSQAIGALEMAGLPSAGRLAAMLDLEPEAIALAAKELVRGVSADELEKSVLTATDPGAALATRAEEALHVEPVRIAACQVAPPILRAFAMGSEVRKARARMNGKVEEKLPPLEERITGDEEEFTRLMQLLLTHYVDSRAFILRGDVFSAAFDFYVDDGFPEMNGEVAVSTYWRPIRRNLVDFQAQFYGNELGLNHWLLLSPTDFTTTERAQFEALGFGKTFKFHLWGQTEIEPLLRKCPPLLARYYPEEARAYLPGYDGTDFRTLGIRYREKVADAHSRIKTIGIPPEVRRREGGSELPLAELFIPLRLVPEKSHAQPLNLAHALLQSKNGVVLADPGMGKSTLLAYLALVFCGQVDLGGSPPSPRIVPMHISLRDFVRRQKEKTGLSFIDYLETTGNTHRAFFESALLMGEAVVLLDGLDEVGNETARHGIASAIRAFQADYPESRFWVTSRIYGYTENVRLPKTFDHFRIDRLDKAQIDDFVARWYKHQLADANEAAEQAKSLSEAIQKTASVQRLAGNPLLLTLMAFIHQGLRKLPKDRGELYEQCIKMLLRTWEEAKHGDGENPRAIKGISLNDTTQKDYLAHLAFFIQQRNQSGKDDESRGLISRRDAIDALTRRHIVLARRERPQVTELEARDEMERFLDYVCDGTGLLLDRGNDQISFIHLSFQEYLAAWVFLCGTDLPKGPEFFLEHLGDPAWEEVLLLRLYIVSRIGGGLDEFDRIVGAILRTLERKDNPDGWLMLVRAIRDDLEFTQRDQREILQRGIGYWLERPTFVDNWFQALSDVESFGERARNVLHKLIIDWEIDWEIATCTRVSLNLMRLEAQLTGFLDNAAAGILAMFETVDLIQPTTTAVELVRPAATITSPAPKEAPKERVLYSWVQLSDSHFGHRSTSHQWDQKLVLESLLRDIERIEERNTPKPESILVTGDIAFSGAANQYKDAEAWLDKVGSTLAISRDHIFIVPGNHDIDREVDRKNRNAARLIRALRDGDDLVDDILDNAGDRELLASRMAAYLEFASHYPSIKTPDPLFWSHSFTSKNGLPVRLIGLPTALLAAGDIDRGKLRIGKKPLASTINDAQKDRELVLVLTHHPLQGGWLADQSDVNGWVQNRAHVHLFGHVHESDSEYARSGSGRGILRIAAGAVHGDQLPPGTPASHGYNIAAVLADANGQLRLRIWPRRWSEPNKEFRVDIDNVREGQAFAEHPLEGNLSVSALEKS